MEIWDFLLDNDHNRIFGAVSNEKLAKIANVPETSDRRTLIVQAGTIMMNNYFASNELSPRSNDRKYIKECFRKRAKFAEKFFAR